MKLITLFLTIASTCIGAALIALGNVYFGILFMVTPVIIAVSQKMIRQFNKNA